MSRGPGATSEPLARPSGVTMPGTRCGKTPWGLSKSAITIAVRGSARTAPEPCGATLAPLWRLTSIST